MFSKLQIEILEYLSTSFIRVRMYKEDGSKPSTGYINALDWGNEIIYFRNYHRGKEQTFRMKDLYFVDYAKKKDIGFYRIEELFPDRKNPTQQEFNNVKITNRDIRS